MALRGRYEKYSTLFLAAQAIGIAQSRSAMHKCEHF